MFEPNLVSIFTIMRLKLNQRLKFEFCSLFHSKASLALIICWLLTQLILFIYLGINDQLEAVKYLKAGSALRDDLVFNNRYLFYNFFVSIIALMKFPVLIVFFQVLISGVAAFHIKQASKVLGIQGNLATFLFITCYTVQIWNFALYTESLFISLLVILFSLILQKKSFSWIAIVAFCAFFCRPTFVVFIPAFLHLMISSRDTSKQWYLILLPILLLAFINRTLYFSEFFSFFVSDQIICELPVLSDTSVFELVTQKVFYFFIGIRGHYSNSHNAYMIVYSTCYLLVIFALLKWSYWQQHRLMFFYLMFFTYLLFVSATCVNWNNRFLAPLLPFVFILSEIGVKHLVQTIRVK